MLRHKMKAGITGWPDQRLARQYVDREETD